WPRQSAEESRWASNAEKMGEQDRRLSALHAQELQMLGHPTLDLLGGDALEQTEAASKQIDDGAVCHRAPVRGARGFQYLHSFRFERVQKLVEQPGFANARITEEQRDCPVAVGGPAVDRRQRP